MLLKGGIFSARKNKKEQLSSLSSIYLTNVYWLDGNREKLSDVGSIQSIMVQISYEKHFHVTISPLCSKKAEKVANRRMSFFITQKSTGKGGMSDVPLRESQTPLAFTFVPGLSSLYGRVSSRLPFSRRWKEIRLGLSPELWHLFSSLFLSRSWTCIPSPKSGTDHVRFELEAKRINLVVFFVPLDWWWPL